MARSDGNKQFWSDIRFFIVLSIEHDLRWRVVQIFRAADPKERARLHPRFANALPLGKEHDERWKQVRAFSESPRVMKSGWREIMEQILLASQGEHEEERWPETRLLPPAYDAPQTLEV